jgi:hypothetical protein
MRKSGRIVVTNITQKELHIPGLSGLLDKGDISRQDDIGGPAGNPGSRECVGKNSIRAGRSGSCSGDGSLVRN